MNLWLPTLIAAYLLGAIPFGYLLVFFFLKEDVRATGSGNIGATNVSRAGGKKLGIATLVLDALKAVAAVMLARHLAPGNLDLAVAAGAVAVLGHMFPVWLGFRGGKGVASALGAFLALSLAATGVGVLIFLLIVLTTRYVSLASIAAAAITPFVMLYFLKPHTPIALTGIFLIGTLIIVKHHQNISRLLSGTESRFGQKKVTA